MLPMLVRLCCHVERSDKIQMMLAAEELSEGAFDLARYDLLTKMAERESRIIASLMTKLRMTSQGTYDKSKKEAAPRKSDGPGSQTRTDGEKVIHWISASSYLFDIYPEISFRQAGGRAKVQHFGCRNRRGSNFSNRNLFRLR